MRRSMVLAPFAAAVVLATAFTGTSAADGVTAAEERNGECENLEFCLFYNSDLKGSVSDHDDWVSDFAPYVFKGKGAGQGQVVKNNAASACNMMSRYTARVYYNSDYKGAYDDVEPRTCRNLDKTYNENASFKWLLL